MILLGFTGQIPNWWEWGYWVSPLAYGYNAFVVNEMYASRWMNRLVSSPNACLILYFKNFEMLLNFLFNTGLRQRY